MTQLSDVPCLDIDSVINMDDDALCHRLLLGDPSFENVENRVIYWMRQCHSSEIVGDLIATTISNQQQLFRFNFVLCYICFSCFVLHC